MKGKRRQIKWWVVPFLVIGAIVAVAGVTTLVMYLSGALDENSVEPSDISFSSEIQSGLAHYDSSTEDSSGSYGTYYTSSDFSIVITTSTEDVTADTVTLSLYNGQTTSDGYITDGIITIPQTVKLNTAFTISLVTDADESVVGGTSRITARSENTTARYKTVFVSVDVPASSFALSVADTNTDSDGVFEVVEGTTFSVESIFSPVRAKYLYSDSLTTKEVFYTYTDTENEYITLSDSANGTFTADEVTSGTTIAITAYSFTSAYAQEQFLSKYSGVTDREILAKYLENESDANADILTSTIYVKVVEVTVESMTITDSLTLTITADKTYTLTANSSTGDGTLGAVVVDTNSQERASLVSNIGIRVTGDLESDEYTLSGGLLIRVAADGSISQVKSVSGDGATYYYLPNTSISPITQYGNYYWTFATTAELELTNLENLSVSLCVNYFYQNSNGVWCALYASDKTATIDIETKTEEAASWSSPSALELEITYNTSTGSEVAASQLLSELLSVTEAFAANTYQTVKYFFVFSSSLTSEERAAIQAVFNVADEEEEYSTDYVGKTLTYGTSGSYYLLEILDDHLIASTTSTSSYNIVAVTVRTDVNGNIVEGNGTKYQIVNISSVKQVKVTSALSVVNMRSSYVLLNNETAKYGDDSYYLPYITYDTNGTKINQIKFVLNLVKKSQDDLTNLTTAISDGNLILQAVNASTYGVVDSGTFTTTWGTALEATDQNGQEFVQISATVSMDEESFAKLASSQTSSQGYYFRLSYYNGETTEYGDYMAIYRYNDAGDGLQTEETVGEETVSVSSGVSTLYVYYPKPTSISTGYESYLADSISVSIKASGVEIKWGTVEIDSVSAINDYLIFDLVDQYGNYIISEGVDGSTHSTSSVCSIKMVEEGNSSIITMNSSGQINSFVASNATTYLTPYVVDKNSSETTEASDYSEQSSLTITFVVESEGLNAVKYDSGTSTGSLDPTTEASNMGSITVSKLVYKNWDVNLSNLFKIYVGSGNTQTETTAYKIYFADTMTSNEDLAKMFTFKVTNDPSTYTLTDYFDDPNNEKWDAGIYSLSFKTSFGKDTTISFVIVSDEELFEIEFNFVCLTGGTIGSSFGTYAAQSAGTLKYGDFLATYTDSNGTTYDSVFANETYALNKYLPINSLIKLTWTQYGSTDQSASSLLSITTVGDEPCLKISDITTAQLVTFTIYCDGVDSSYAVYTTLTLYVVPNYVVVEGDSYYTLGSDDNEVSFTFYKATDYIDYLNNGTTPTALNLSGVTFNQYNSSYITIEYDNAEQAFSYGSLSTAEASIALGESLAQTFSLQNSSGQTFQMARVTSSGVVTTDSTSGLTLLTVEIGLGSAEETIKAIFGVDADNKANVQLVEYEGTKILLGSEESLIIDIDGRTYYSFYTYSGMLSSGGTITVVASQVDSLSEGSVTILGKFDNFKIYISVDVLISATGTEMVLYSASDSTFNTYEDVDLQSLTGLNLSSNEAIALFGEGGAAESVFEEVEAGQSSLTLVYSTTNDISEVEFGMFYKDSSSVYSAYLDCISLIGILNDGYSTQKSISVDELISIASRDASTGNISITINNLSDSYSYVYAIFKLTVVVSGTQNVFYYRLKILPNFTNEEVTYPIASSAEYLDSDSQYYTTLSSVTGLTAFESGVVYYIYNAGSFEVVTATTPNASEVYYYQKTSNANASYVLDLSEEISQTSLSTVTGLTAFVEDDDATSYIYYTYDGSELTSVDKTSTPDLSVTYYLSTTTKFTRFTAPDGATLTGYEIESVTVDGTSISLSSLEDYFDVLSISDGVLTICPNSTYSSSSISIEIVASYIIGSLACFGGDLSYTIVINGSKEYEYSLTATNGKLTNSGSTYSLTVAAGSTVDSLTPTIYRNVGSGQNPELVTALIDGDEEFFKYIGFDGSTLIVTAPPSVETNATVTISFCSSEKIVFKLVVTFTSFYVATLNTDFSGGTNYEVYDTTSETADIFSELYSSKADVDISSVDLSILQSVTGLSAFESGYAYYTYDNTTYTQVIDTTSTPEEETEYFYCATTTQYGTEVSLYDLYKFTSGSSYGESTLEFAHLLEDTEFTFSCTISDGSNPYTFTFTITVKASFDVASAANETFNANGLTSTTSITNASGLYGGLTYNYYINNADGTYSISGTQVTSQSTSLSTFGFDKSCTTSSTIEPAYVASNTTVSKNVSIYVFFNGKNLFTFTVKLTYLDLPSVSIDQSYPVTTNGEGEEEYLQVVSDSSSVYLTTKAIEKFFSGTAYFAESSRLVVKNVYDTTSTNQMTENADFAEVAISIYSIDNAQVFISGSTSTTLTDVGEEVSSTILESGIGSLSVRFDLLDSSLTSGSVTFKITINGVIAYYTVYLTQNDVVSLKQNSPTSTTSGAETIYAEDLAGYEEATIFTQDRLLSFTANSSTSLTFVFKNGTVQEPLTVTAEADTATIIDLGKSYTGWEIYSVNDLTDYSSLFSSSPIFTARIVATYANGGQVEIQDSDLTISSTSTTTYSDLQGKYLADFNFTYSSESKIIDTDETLTLTISYKTYTTTYSILLTTDIQVADDAQMTSSSSSLPAYVDITAGNDITLLNSDTSSSSLASALGIKTKSGSVYSSSTVEENNASVLIQEYGFSDLEVTNSSTDANTASSYYIHNFLQENKIKNASGTAVLYSTGITPAAGMTSINTSTYDQSTVYLKFAGETPSNSTINYTLSAKGARNDGNFVLLRFTYTVTITIDVNGTETDFKVNKVFNLLVRVLPNVTATYKNSSSSSYTSFATNQQYGTDYTVASNKTDPYQIKIANLTDSTYVFALFEDGLAGATDKTMVISSSTDLTATRTMSYEYGAITYNDGTSSTWGGTVSSTNSMWTIDGTTSTASTTSFKYVSITTSNLIFGQKSFMITLTDAFEYEIQFYFNLISEDNPTLSISGNLVEGNTLLFYAQTTPVTANKDTFSFDASGNITYSESATVTTTTYLVYDSFEYSIGTSSGYKYVIFETSNASVSGVILSTTYSGSDPLYYSSGTKLTSGTIMAVTTPTSGVIDLTSVTWSYNGNALYTDSACSSAFKISSTALSSGTMIVYVSASTSGIASAAGKVDVYASTDGTTKSKQLYLSYSLPGSKVGVATSTFGTGDTETTIEVANSSESGSKDIAYGFSSSDALDVTSAKKKYSSIAQYLSVTSIDFYYSGTKLGSASYTGTGSSQSSQVTLNTLYYYVDSEGIQKQGPEETTNVFSVPNIKGIYYDLYGGTDGVIEGVTMYVTIIYNNTNTGKTATTVVEKTVNLQRQSFNIFQSTTISDGSAPVLNTDETTTKLSPSGATILNDTLEVDLDAGESVTLAITTTKFDYDSYTGKYYNYIRTTDTSPNSAKTYYNSNFESITSVSVDSFYSSTTDTTPTKTKTYYTKADDVYTAVTGLTEFVSGTGYYELAVVYERVEVEFTTITNNNNYKTTEYISISEYVSDELEARLSNLTSSDKFYVYAIGTKADGTSCQPTIRYAGSSGTILGDSITSGDYYTNGGTTITTYPTTSTSELSTTSALTSALTIEIPSVEALSGGNSMSRTLYFVVSTDVTTYRYAQAFSVQAKYTSATSSAITVTEFYSVSNSTNTFYVVPLTSWASKIKLTGLTSADEFSDATNFTFKVVDGSAYIDENGTITTGTDFQRGPSTVEIEVFMNVSGTDGKFQEHNTESALSLGTFTISLSDSVTVGGTAIVSNSDTTPTTKVYTDSSTNPTCYTVVTIPVGYSLYGTSSISDDTISRNNDYSYTTTLSVELGGTIDFSTKLTSVAYTNTIAWTNVAYHIISEGIISEGTSSTSQTPVTGIELDEHTFTTQGKRVVYVLVTGYLTSGTTTTYQATLVAVTVVVYDNSSTATTETQTYAVEVNGSFSPKGTGETWYSISADGTASSATFDTSSQGYTTSTYYVITSGTTTTYKLVKLNLFVYSSTQSKSALVVKNGTFTLSSLDSTATFYACENLTNGLMDNTSIITYDTISTAGSRQYLAVTYDSDGDVDTVTLWTVKFSFVSSLSAEATYGAYVKETTVKGEVELESSSRLTAFVEGVNYYTYNTSSKTYVQVDTTVTTTPVSNTTYYYFASDVTYYTYDSTSGYQTVDTSGAPVAGETYYSDVKGIGSGSVTSAITKAIYSEFGVEPTSVQALSSSGVLSDVADIATYGDTVSSGNLFYVTYTLNDTPTSIVISMNFYVYSSKLKAITYYAQNSTTSSLSALDDLVKTRIKEAEYLSDTPTISTITYQMVSGSTISAVASVNLQEATEYQLFVLVLFTDGDIKCYLLNANYNVYNTKTKTIISGTTISSGLSSLFSSAYDFEVYTNDDDQFSTPVDDEDASLTEAGTYVYYVKVYTEASGVTEDDYAKYYVYDGREYKLASTYSGETKYYSLDYYRVTFTVSA